MKELDKKIFAQRLKTLRKANNLYQKELADIVGVKPGTIAAWEAGHRMPEIRFAERLATYFNVSVDYLLGRTDDPTPKKDDSLTKKDPLFKLFQNPDSLTVEEALDMVLKSPHVMFDGKPVGEMDEDILMDIRDTVVAILKYKANLKKAVAGMRGVLSDCLAVVAGMG